MALFIFASAVFLSFIGALSNGQSLQNSIQCSDLYRYKGRDYPANVMAALKALQNSTAYNITTKGNNNTVYGMLQCRGDISGEDCSSCAASAIKSLNQSCVARNQTLGGRVQQEKCFLRYEDHFFFSNYSGIDSPITECSNTTATAQFLRNKQIALGFVKTNLVQRVGKFVIASAGGSSDTVYALGQCVPELSSTDCTTCLTKAEGSLCGNGDAATCYLAECMLQYARTKFFAGSPDNANATTAKTTSRGSNTTPRTIGITVGVTTVVLVVVGFLITRLMSLKKRKIAEDDDLQGTLHRGPVTFSYEMLKRSTGDFDDSHKLGEGGFGSVYKGYFLDGTEVAIKKLSIASKQGEQQFLNEVKAISSVQHRNLVKLLGCSTEGSERLLVYELMKNNSLEKALFGIASDEERLSWARRFSVLIGTARGLTYLHEDSQIRIIHRDIKPSNILLDDYFEAKISDFGLARLYEGEDELTEVITTKVAGTYGYMAPEYAFHGHLSEKADVFSFGIVVLETISGRKNRLQYLVEQAWMLRSEDNLGSFIDPKMGPVDDTVVHNVVSVALMCTQASPQARPSMSHVVAMLCGHSNAQIPPGLTYDPPSSVGIPSYLSSSGTSSVAGKSSHTSSSVSSVPQQQPEQQLPSISLHAR